MHPSRLALSALLAALAACQGAAAPSKPAVVAVGSAGAAAALPAVESEARDVVVVRASGAASRRPERPRVLRRLIAARRGDLEVARGFTSVQLSVTEVVSGELDDPDYAKRPIGVNALPVVLTDEAAYAAPDGLDGFAGEWRLTRAADGALVASAITDTPFPREAAADRAEKIAKLREGLRASSAEERLAALGAFGDHAYLMLVPDVIALLDDTRDAKVKDRYGGSYVQEVRLVAFDQLPRLLYPLRLGMPSSDRAACQALWRQLLDTPPGDPRPVIASTTTVLADASLVQTASEAAATRDGLFALPFESLTKPIDGAGSGVLLFRPGGKRLWISPSYERALAIAANKHGAGVLSFERGWKLALAGAAPAKPVTVTATVDADASHAALAASDGGWLLAYTRTSKASLFVQELDARGKPRGGERPIPLPRGAQPMTQFHRGVFPLAVARRTDGWLLALETTRGLARISLDDQLAVVASEASREGGTLASPKLTGDRRGGAFLLWSEDERLAYALVDRAGRLEGEPHKVGDEVGVVSQPITLEDGRFAAAWIESRGEIHVGLWDPRGVLLGEGLVQRATSTEGGIAIAIDGNDLVVVHHDATRYPFSVVARRIEPRALVGAR